ncbi:mechanosensitive ion channel protein [Ammoniphilus oxalaticus]|uniref:Mechanosensitive ion channel protein n=2 Tax=Ammoniphilus oxalaticus TaxID=66863 RepID=A0A419SP33_9BACL|nr:mechanosensitive ion channel protein [Ammoniphilus oxalaticus]
MIEQWIKPYLQAANGWENVVIAIGVFLFSLLLRKIIIKYVFQFILKLTHKTKQEITTQVFLAFEKPLQVMMVLIGIKISLSFIVLEPATNVVITRAFRSAIILLMTWGVFTLTGESSQWLQGIARRFDIDIDKIVIPFFSKIIRFFVIALAISIVAQEWDYEVTGLITGLGIGGLAFAFAAQDAIGNIFGGLIIITEKPFGIGDWIETPSVEGTVEDITFRSTRVRTFGQALVTVPNSKLANEPIVNWSKMGKRRVTFTLRVTYTTPRDKLRNCVEKIRTMLQEHPEVDQEVLFANFDEFDDHGLAIILYFFTKTTNWGEWLRVKEDCNLKIMQILEEEGVTIALPSTSVYYGNNLQSPPAIDWNPDQQNKTG